MSEVPTPSVRPRLESVDLLRGLVMVLMALDHTRDFFGNVPYSPVDLDHTTPALFLTRWITHFCAPVFVFLAGAGAFLSTTRGRGATAELSRYLAIRGLWLVALDLVYFNTAWMFHFTLHWLSAMVLWAIGWSLVTLAALVWLPRNVALAFGLVLIVGHNALDGLKPSDSGVWSGLWRILHAAGVIDLGAGFKLAADYPLIPWIGVVAVGYAFGPMLLVQGRFSSDRGARPSRSLWSAFRRPAERKTRLTVQCDTGATEVLGEDASDSDRDGRAPHSSAGGSTRRKRLAVLGAVLTIAFVAIRWSNVYGNPVPWSHQKDAVFTVIAFLNCQKYPPSLCFLLMTFGPALLLLAAFDRGVPRMLRPLVVFGRVPLFYYVLHIPLIHGVYVLTCLVRFGRADWSYGFQPGVDPHPPVPPNAGFSLPVVYLFWVLFVAALYPACRWFAGLKQRRRDAGFDAKAAAFGGSSEF